MTNEVQPVDQPGRPASTGVSGRRGPVVIVAAVSVLALGGAVTSVGSVLGRRAGEAVHATGESVPTSFGIVAVEFANVLHGLSPAELGGQTHGVKNLVGEDKAGVRANVTVTNLSNSPVPLAASQFRVLLGRSQTPVPLTSTSITSGVLQPNSNIDEQLTFVVPRSNQPILVEFRDPDGRRIKIRVGHTDQAPLDTTSHSH